MVMDLKRQFITVIVIIFVIAAAVGAAYYLMGGSRDDDSVYYTTVSPPDMKLALDTGTVDGYIAWEPYCSDSIVEGIGHALTWSGEIRPDHPCCVILVSDAFLASENGIELTARFLRAHMDATDWINEAIENKDGDNYTELIQMAVQFTARDSEVIESALEHMKFEYAITEDFYDALEWYTESFIEIQLIDEDALLENYDSTEDFAQSYVNETFLATAAEVEESESIVGEVKMGFLIGDLHQIAQVVARNSTLFGDKSLFEKYGVSVTNAVGAPYANGPAEMENFAQGNVDIGYLGAPPAILAHININVGAKMIAGVNTEGSALIVSHDITSLEDLKGKTIAIPGTGTIQYLLLQVLLRDAGISLRAA